MRRLLALGRRQAEDVLADIEQLLGRSREQVSEQGRRAPAASFPIERYDELTAAQVVARLDGLTPAELRKLRDHERFNANRKTVRRALERALIDSSA